jgi:hypothetical protein
MFIIPFWGLKKKKKKKKKKKVKGINKSVKKIYISRCAGI